MTNLRIKPVLNIELIKTNKVLIDTPKEISLNTAQIIFWHAQEGRPDHTVIYTNKYRITVGCKVESLDFSLGVV